MTAPFRLLNVTETGAFVGEIMAHLSQNVMARDCSSALQVCSIYHIKCLVQPLLCNGAQKYLPCMTRRHCRDAARRLKPI